LLKIVELLLKDCLLSLTCRGEADEALLDLLKFLALGLVLRLGSFFLFKEPLRPVFKLTLHLFLIDLDSVFVSLHSAFVIGLHFR